MYDWNTAEVPKWRGARAVQVVDETLRDGLQNATAIDPTIEEKLDLLNRMAAVGVDVVSVGLPAASKRSLEQAVAMTAHIRDHKLPLQPTGAARTVVNDVLGVAEVQQRTGHPVEVYAFIGSSPIRHYTEKWDINFLTKHITESADAARREGVPFTLVTEDTTRARPEMLEQLFMAAIDHGCSRLCLCDTVGHATPDGVARLVKFTRNLLRARGNESVGLDWHAHNDRGLALQTAIWASEVGVDRVHGTVLGIGERVGNVPVELLLLNLGALGSKPEADIAELAALCERAAAAMKIGGIPDTHPLFGKAARQSSPPSAPQDLPPVGPSTAKAADAAQASDRSADSEAPVARDRNDDFVRQQLLRRPVPLNFHVNGDPLSIGVRPQQTLLEVLRYNLDLYGSKQGCDKGDCGACTVLCDGKPILSCLALALDCEGASITTVESLPGGKELHPLLDAFDRTGATQCGFCTPGFLMTAHALLQENDNPSEQEIKEAISGNLCRCTGYQSIVAAIALAAKIKRGEEPAMAGLHQTQHLPGPIDTPNIGRPTKG